VNRINEIQRDLDRFLEYYNLQRSHQGYRLQGRTPAQALREALGVEELPVFTGEETTSLQGRRQPERRRPGVGQLLYLYNKTELIDRRGPWSNVHISRNSSEKAAAGRRRHS